MRIFQQDEWKIKMKLLEKIKNKSAIVGIIGMGYVGLPLALTFSAKKFNVLGFDLDEKKIEFMLHGHEIKFSSSAGNKKVVHSVCELQNEPLF